MSGDGTGPGEPFDWGIEVVTHPAMPKDRLLIGPRSHMEQVVRALDQGYDTVTTDPDWVLAIRVDPPEGGEEMGFTKFGTGEVLPEEGDDQKTASKNWTEEDRQALAAENQED